MTLLSAIARERGIRYFLVAYTDLRGVLRAKLVPARAIDEMAKSGAGFAGFATWFDMTPADPDVLAIPDPATLIQLPWKPEVGWMAADPIMRGTAVEQAPRNVLRRVIAKAAENGLEIRSGVEPEFFLIQPSGAAIADGADLQTKPCYDQIALMRRYDVIAEIGDAMEALGWEPYQNDHEDANGQFEINWAYAPALVTADRQVFFKFMVRTIAERHGLRATFMPKPFADLTGSGCHVHVSVWRDEKNVFSGDDALGLSPLARQFVGGMLEHAPALCALGNPTANSYKRINASTTASGATWSPSAISWGGNNRTHLVRVPGPGRFEYRLADGAANPYLLQAGLLAAGLDGVAQRRDPGEPLDVDMHVASNRDRSSTATGVRRLPLNLLDAVRALEGSSLSSTLGESFTSSYAKLKRQEWDDYMRHLSQWERDQTLDC